MPYWGTGGAGPRRRSGLGTVPSRPRPLGTELEKAANIRKVTQRPVTAVAAQRQGRAVTMRWIVQWDS